MPCLAHDELCLALNGDPEAELPRMPAEADRLEWLLQRHDTDGADGCDWCVLAEEIRRLRATLERH